ncbi:hypothetical protein AQ1_01440 [alpha proteobacterium Q-1]|nr:hypothetical protein AQ1_01440 [alpha proteobacterium Q-1]
MASMTEDEAQKSDFERDKEVQFSRFGTFLFWLAAGHLIALALLALLLL